MRAAMVWIVVGLGLVLGCTRTPPASPPPAGGPAANLEWKREGQQVRLTTKSGDTSYLVVVIDGDSSATTSSGSAPATSSAAAAPAVSEQFGTMTVQAGAGRVAVYALTPLLNCRPGLECAECQPEGGTNADCGLPPRPPVPHFARGWTVFSRAPVGPGGGGR